MIFSSPVKSNVLTMAFGLGVLFYKALEIAEELTFFSNRVGFSYLCVIVKKHDPVLALIVSYNRERAGNISMDKFE